MNERRIAELRNKIAELRNQIAQGKDATGELTSQAMRLLAELDELTQ